MKPDFPSHRPNLSLPRVNRGPYKKVVILPLDGVPCSLLTHYMNQGVMPHFKEMVSMGVLLPLTSTLPEVSSVAWASFMTGQNPAGHGIFGFMEVDNQSYEFRFPNFLSLKSPTFWEKLGVAAVSFNLPQTYPARATNGVIISGFVAPDLEKAVYPRRLYDYCKSTGYRLDVRSALAANDPEAFFKDLFEVFAKRCEMMTYLYTQEDWQIFIGAITETDRLHHFFFDSATGGKYYEVFVEFYRRLDKLLWEMFNRAQKDGALFLTCSDHGFAPIKSEVYVATCLKQQGFLRLADPGGLKNITPDSRAFCLEPARIYLHLKDKYARGPVNGSEYEANRQELKEVFESLSYNGGKVVKKVFFKEEIFSGPYVNEAPDLYILGEPGFDLKSSLNKETVFGRSHFRGAHTYTDAHLFLSDSRVPLSEFPGSIDGIPSLIDAFMTQT